MKENIKPILLTFVAILAAYAAIRVWEHHEKKWAAKRVAAATAAAEARAAAAAGAEDAAEA